jgi:hypothetical protein
MAKRTGIRGLLKWLGISDLDADRIGGMMGSIKDVMEGKRARPGGAGCSFPHLLTG